MNGNHAKPESVDLQLGKSALRSRFLEARASLDDESRKQADQAICSHILALLERMPRERVRPGTSPVRPVVGLYRAFRGEVDVFPLADVLQSWGWGTAFPVTHRAERELTYHWIQENSSWRAGAYGITEPDETNPPVPVGDLDVLLIPGVAFTKDGWRVGYGGGYYDKLLANPSVQAARIGVAYGCQLADVLPHEAHDVRMHWVVTPEGCLPCPATL